MEYRFSPQDRGFLFDPNNGGRFANLEPLCLDDCEGAEKPASADGCEPRDFRLSYSREPFEVAA
jgi:hypothetical protein